MTDAERAKASLAGHTIALCRGEEVLVSDLRGISPMLSFIGEGKNLSGWSVADVVVGKAATLLFAYAGVKEVWAEVLSDAGARALEANGIPFACATRAPYIVNRQGDGMCPMEMTVQDICDPAEAYAALRRKADMLRANARK